MIYHDGQPVWVRSGNGREWAPGTVIRQVLPVCPLSGGGAFYEIDLEGFTALPGSKWGACPCFLRPRDGDERKPVDWATCQWKPKVSENA